MISDNKTKSITHRGSSFVFLLLEELMRGEKREFPCLYRYLWLVSLEGKEKEFYYGYQ